MEPTKDLSVYPLVSVIVLYYKRRETIEETLDSVQRQDYPNRELIVIDNHSQDDLGELISSQYPECRLFEMPENIGTCAGRNVGLSNARGQFLVFLEDDVSLCSAFELSKMMGVWEAHPEVHVLALQVCDPDTGQLRLREWCHPRYWREFSETEFETWWFGEGAVAFRRTVFDFCGPYYEPFFYGAEGDDLVIRLFNRGFRILHAPQVRVGHRASETGRSSERQFYYFTRNYFWTACKDFYLLDGLRYLVPKLLMMGYFAIRTGSYRPLLRGIWDGLKGVPAVRKQRSPASPATMRYLRELGKSRPNLFVRLARHKTAPQL
jgi:GT2 family glycosyltransferase